MGSVMDQERPWERHVKPEAATLRERIKDVLRDKNHLHETVEQIVCELERLEAMIITPAPQSNGVAKPSADVHGLLRAAADIIQDERDAIAVAHTVNGVLQFDDDDFLSQAAIEDMDNWLISAKDALYPLDVMEGSADA